jgi:hypothetical protein
MGAAPIDSRGEVFLGEAGRMEQVGVPGTAGWSNRETGNTKRQEGRLKRSALHGRLKSGPLAAASGPYTSQG